MFCIRLQGEKILVDLLFMALEFYHFVIKATHQYLAVKRFEIRKLFLPPSADLFSSFKICTTGRLHTIFNPQSCKCCLDK